MRILFAVLCLFVVYAASYPSLRDIDVADNDESDDLQLELRSILKHLSNNDEQMERSFAFDDDNSNENDDSMSERQGGYNTINADMKCEIECVGKLRDPSSGHGLSVKEATKACKNLCATRK